MEFYVFAKHYANGKPYLFATPDATIIEGDILIVQTRYGRKHVTAVTNAFYSFRGAIEEVAKAVGATFPLKKALGKVQFFEDVV